jgi:hypothetical protein
VFDTFVSLSVGVIAAVIVSALVITCWRWHRRRRRLKQRLYIISYPNIGSKLANLTADDVDFYRSVAASARPPMAFEVREMTPEEKEAAYD